MDKNVQFVLKTMFVMCMMSMKQCDKMFKMMKTQGCVIPFGTSCSDNACKTESEADIQV